MSGAAEQPEGGKWRGIRARGQQPCQPAARPPCPAGPQRQLTALQPGLQLSLTQPAAPIKETRCAGTRWAQTAARTGVPPTPPAPQRSRLGCRNRHRAGFSQGQEGAALFSSICSNQTGLQGEKMGLQSSSSSPLTPYLSNLTQAREQKEVIDRPGSEYKIGMCTLKWKRIYEPLLPGGTL